MTDLSLVTRIVCSHKATGVRSLNSANFEEFEVEEDDMDTSLVGTSFCFFFHVVDPLLFTIADIFLLSLVLFPPAEKWPGEISEKEVIHECFAR